MVSIFQSYQTAIRKYVAVKIEATTVAQQLSVCQLQLSVFFKPLVKIKFVETSHTNRQTDKQKLAHFNQVIHQMSRLLKVNQSDIKRAIDENRLDWISAIYHLLMRDKEQHAAAKVSNVSFLMMTIRLSLKISPQFPDEHFLIPPKYLNIKQSVAPSSNSLNISFPPPNITKHKLSLLRPR